jgi:uncharacterized protein (DUF2267 family)
MKTTKMFVRGAAFGAATIGFVTATFPDSPVGRTTRRLGDRLARDIRYVVASAPGILYRLAGRRPDPDVSDDILADRIRSAIGPLEKRLDVPRVHVMVDDHSAILHGDVSDECVAAAIEEAVMCVSGVDGVESHLHTTLERGDTRPSAGRATTAPSQAYTSLLAAAREGGALDTRAAVHAVLCGFLDQLPAGERSHIDAHLPDDVRALVGPPRYSGRPHRTRTVLQLVAAVIAEGGIDAARAEDITLTVLDAFQHLVPEEARDIEAVLPEELRELWRNASVS